MTVLTQNVEDMLKRLETHSKSELNLIRALAAAIREVDDATLRELRNITLQHELRRETILGELHGIAQRMCQLPARPASSIKSALEHPGFGAKEAATDAIEIAGPAHHTAAQPHAPNTNGAAGMNGAGADWRQAAQKIDEELDFARPAKRQYA